MSTKPIPPVLLHILLVDPYASERPALMVALRKDYQVTVVQTGEEAVQAFKQDPPSMIIVDAGDQNLEILALIEEYDKQIPLLLVGHHTNDEYNEQGFNRSALKMWIEHTIISRQLHTKVANLSPEETRLQAFGDLVTCSPELVEVFAVLHRVVKTDVSILITGESGTGKELIARGIHELSERKEQPFVAINCAAIPEQLLETELFGYEKGAFTGATATKVGKLEYAGGGTVFLDEIGDMPLLTQAKLLRVLEERVLERVGGHQRILFRARILAATNKHLHEEVQQHKFREDLLYRLNTIHVTLPPLRERRDDIPLLTNHFLRNLNERYNKQILGISPVVLNALQKHDWPGNARELLNTIQHAVLLSTGPRIELKDLPAQFQMGVKATILLNQLGTLPLATIIDQAKDDLERQIILATLERFRYSKLRCANYLGIDRKTLYRKMKALGIQDQEGTDP
jgi:two-component system response regulator AtoC